MSRLTLVVLGMMGRCPFGGQTWLYINWLRGLHRLGHEVWYVEDDATWPYDPRANQIVDDPGYAAEYLDRVTREIGLAGRWAYRPLFRGPDECLGLDAAGPERKASPGHLHSTYLPYPSLHHGGRVSVLE